MPRRACTKRGATSLYDVRFVWHEGYEANVTVRARSSREARAKAREFVLNRTTVPPTRATVRRLQVMT